MSTMLAPRMPSLLTYQQRVQLTETLKTIHALQRMLAEAKQTLDTVMKS